MTCLNLVNHTGEVSLDELFNLREYFTDAVEKLQNDIDGDSGFGASIEGNGFNIAFGVNGKKYFLRCELDDRFDSVDSGGDE